MQYCGSHQSAFQQAAARHYSWLATTQQNTACHCRRIPYVSSLLSIHSNLAMVQVRHQDCQPSVLMDLQGLQTYALAW